MRALSVAVKRAAEEWGGGEGGGGGYLDKDTGRHVITAIDCC